MELFRNYDGNPSSSSSTRPVTPPQDPLEFHNIQQLSTPPSNNVSPNYTYDQDDYFQYKQKSLIQMEYSSAKIHNISTIIDEPSPCGDKNSFVSPVEPEDSMGFLDTKGRRGSIIPSNVPTSVNTPVSDDKSYIPLTAPYKFLCVDDNSINLRILSKLLSKLFPQSSIETTTNPLEALKMIDNKSYDMCFLDIEMPELSGKELAEHVRKTNLNLGLIAVTTRAGSQDVREYENLGIDTTFAKPLRYSYSLIMDSIETVITRRSTPA